MARLAQISVRRRLCHAHRVAWLLSGRELPTSKFVLHTCDNRACVRPDHLYLGNQSRNMLDMVARGRCYNAKLSDADVLAIRASGESSSVLARRYGVHPGHVRKVRRLISKPHVNAPGCFALRQEGGE